MIAWRTWPWWCKLLAIGGAVIAVTVVSFATWFFSDADLRRVEERAKAMGVATTWEEFGVEIPPGEVLAAWTIFESRTRPLKSWVESNGYDKVRLPVIGELPPPSFLEHVHAVAPILAEAIDALPPHRLIPGNHGASGSRVPSLSLFRNPMKLQGEVVLAAETSSLPDALRRFYRLVEDQPTHLSQIGHLIQVGNCSSLLHPTAARHAELDRTTCLDLASRLEVLSIQLETLGKASMRGSFIEFLRELSAGDVELLFMLSNTGSNSDWLNHLAFRCGRSPLLHAQLDWVEMIENTPKASERKVILMARIQAAEALPRWSPSGTLLKTILPAWQMMENKSNQVRSQLILAARLLRHDDPGLDPISGEAYVRYERDDRVIGWYSPGLDGDDGGDQRKDWCLPWYEPWKIPTRPIMEVPSEGTSMPEPGTAADVETTPSRAF